MFCKESEKDEFLKVLRSLETSETKVRVTELADRLGWDQNDFDRVCTFLKFEDQIKVKYHKVYTVSKQAKRSISFSLVILIVVAVFCSLPAMPGVWNILTAYPSILAFVSATVVAICAEERYLTVLLQSSLRWSYLKDRSQELKHGRSEDEVISGNLVSGMICDILLGGRPVLFEMGAFRLTKVPIKTIIKLKVYLTLIPFTILYLIAYMLLGPSLDLDIANAVLLWKYFIIIAGSLYILTLKEYRKREEITVNLLMYKPKDVRLAYQWLYAEWGERNLMSRYHLEKLNGDTEAQLDPQKPLYVKIKARKGKQKNTFSHSLKYKYYQPSN